MRSIRFGLGEMVSGLCRLAAVKEVSEANHTVDSGIVDVRCSQSLRDVGFAT